MNEPEVINYRRTLSRKIVTLTGATDKTDAERVALHYTGETYGRLYNIFTEELPNNTFIVNLCTD